MPRKPKKASPHEKPLTSLQEQLNRNDILIKRTGAAIKKLARLMARNRKALASEEPSDVT